jgi:O-antigen/teichoic acid export membrane protein
VALYAFTKPDLWQVAIAVSIAALFQFVTLFAVWKRLTPELRIDRSAMTAETRGIVFTTGGWILVVSLGTALLVSSDLIVISRFFNTGEVAKYAVVVLWASVLRGVFTSLAASVTPSLVALEARGDMLNLLAVSSQTIRVSGALCAHCAGVLAGMSVPILTVWLRKPWAADIAPLAWIILFPLCFEVSFYTLLPAILTAKARVRAQAIVSVAIGVFGVILAVILVQVTNLGLYAVALSSGVAALVRYAVVNPIQAGAALPGAGWVFYLRQGAPTALRFAGTALIAYAAARYLQPDHYLTLAGCALAVTAVTLPINYACLPREDHVVFKKLLRIS